MSRVRTVHKTGLTIFAALLVAGTLTTSASAAKPQGIKPLKHSMGEFFEQSEFDGTDIYLIRGSKSRWLVRESFKGTPTKKLMKLAGDETEEDDVDLIDDIWAGGGHVAVTFMPAGNGLDPARSEVVRISRDGSTRQVLATGAPTPGRRSDVVKVGDKELLNDCGTRVSALSVSKQGAVVISELTRERESPECGGKPNVDHWRVYEISLSGVTREIYSEDRTPAVFPYSPGAAEVVGDLAIYRPSRSAYFFVRDLRTGVVTGPFGTGMRGDGIYDSASMSPAGLVVMHSYATRGRDIASEREVWKPSEREVWKQGIFTSPLSPTPFKEVRNAWHLEFCGSHLIAGLRDDVYELNPVSRKRKRLIARFPNDDFSWIALSRCDENYFYAANFRRGGPFALAYRIG